MVGREVFRHHFYSPRPRRGWRNPGCPAHKHADCRSGDGFRGFGDSRASASVGVLEGAQIWTLRKPDTPPDWWTHVRDDVTLIQLPHVHILCHASNGWKGPSFKKAPLNQVQTV